MLGESGRTYLLLSSADLATWTTVLTTNTASGTFEFAEPLAIPAGPRFYRAKAGP